MKHLDLFSGIGGFALAAGWAGFETAMFCEIDPFARRVLAKHWPEVPIHDDIHTLTADVVGQPIDLITGGFPCQPFSVAGKRRGADDDRHLWPEMARVIGEVRPRWVLGENTPGIINMALDDCLADLEDLGYEAWPVVLPACGVGAWHRRERVWIIAHAGSERRQQVTGSAHGDETAYEGRTSAYDHLTSGLCESGLTPNPTDGGVRRGSASGEAGLAALVREDAADATRELSHRSGGARGRGAESPNGDWWESESRVRGIPDGLSRGVDGRAARLKALGNAIVPQVAYEILKEMAT